jgi:NodT family efflux transporter outer membrane factor (OMF) lipoprotein
MPSIHATLHATMHVPMQKRPIFSLLTRAALGWAMGSWLLVACAPWRTPAVNELPPLEIPAQWSGAAPTDPTALAPWWQSFDDALLSRLVGDDLRSNTTVTGARASLRQARALRDVAAAGLSPTLGAQASAQSNRRDAVTVDGFSLGLDAAWEIDVFGGKHDAVDAAQAQAAASAASLGDVQVSVAGEVALAYITLRSAQARLALAQTSLAGQAEILQIARWRLQAGLVSTLDVEQSLAAQEQTRALVPALQTTIAQNIHALAVLSGRAPASLNDVLGTAAAVPASSADIALGIPAETLRQRADIRAAEWQVRRAAAQVSQAEAARLPSFKLGGSLGLNAATLVGLGSGAGVVSMLLASVGLPVIDGGAARATTQAQQAALEKAQSDYRASVLTALKDVEDALTALQADRLRLQSLTLAMDAAGRAAQTALQRYQSGLVDFQTVLDTQRTQLSAQDSQASAFASVSADHVRLYKALGGGWSRATESQL